MKKLLTVLLTFTMLFSAAAASASAASLADTEGKSCETAVGVLTALSIVEGREDGSYDPDGTLTRAEMATIILRTMNMAQTAEGQPVFTDVPASHWAYANIAAAYQLGIVNGTSETTFAPDAPVTYEQAVKMVVAALGYAVQAEAIGGYPTGYLSKAAQLDLLAGVKQGGEMTRGDMAILVYNALDTELFLRSIYGDDAYKFETDETKTLLSYYLKVDHQVAAVEATYAASAVSPAPKLLSDEVRIGGVTMKKGETDAQNMLGMRADVYTREDEITEKPIILAIVPRSGVETEELTVQDVDSFDGNLLSYTDAAGKTQKADLASATVIFNGRTAAKDTAHLIPAMGKLRLISDGGEYKYVIVESYTNYVADSINAEDYIVYFKDGAAPMVIDPTDNSVVTLFTDAEGASVTVSDVAEWDILSVAKSEDSAVVRIYRSKKMAEGQITEMSDEEVVVGDETYPIAPTVLGTLKVGQKAGFYLDFTGAIAALDENYQSGGTYGWLVSAAKTKGIGGVPQFKIFTQDGEMKVFDTTDTVRVNGAGIQKEKLLDPSAYAGNAVWGDKMRTPLTNDAGQAVSQLIRYQTNSDSLLTEIQTAWNYSDPNMDYDAKYGGDFSMDWYYHTAAYVGSSTGPNVNDNANVNNAARFNGEPKGDDNMQYQGKIENISGIFLGHVGTDAATKMFVIPAAGSGDDDYTIRPLDEFDLEPVRNSKYVSFYDIGEDYHCGAIVMHNYMEASDSTGGSGSADVYPGTSVTPALITGISKTLSKDGEAQNTLKLYTSTGVETSVVVDEDDYAFYANTASDIVADTDWYTKDANGERVELTTAAEREAFMARYDSVVKRMYIDVADLVPGDVIQYEADSTGKLKRASVLFRSEYAVHMELYQASSHKITPTSKVLNYMSGGRIMTNGKVIKTGSVGTTIEVHPVSSTGVLQNETFVRTLPKGGKFVLWDVDKDTARAITAADIIQGDEIFTYWHNTNQLLTVVYR